MSTRKQANRAEGIVRGFGALIMLVAFGFVVHAFTTNLKGMNPEEQMQAMLHIFYQFAVTAIGIGIIGVIVWLKVLKGKRKD